MDVGILCSLGACRAGNGDKGSGFWLEKEIWRWGLVFVPIGCVEEELVACYVSLVLDVRSENGDASLVCLGAAHQCVATVCYPGSCQHLTAGLDPSMGRGG